MCTDTPTVPAGLSDIGRRYEAAHRTNLEFDTALARLGLTINVLGKAAQHGGGRAVPLGLDHAPSVPSHQHPMFPLDHALYLPYGLSI